MTGKGVVMTCLATIAAAGTTSCMRPAALPPANSIPYQSTRPVVPDYRVTPSPAPVGPLLRPDPSQSSIGPRPNRNPWQPAVEERDWEYIVLHHTATDAGSVESIHESHLRRKDKNGQPWKGIGYHFVVGNGNGMPDGSIEPTFRWREQMHGAHAGVQDYNDLGIGVVLIGNFEEHEPTVAQIDAVKRLVATLQAAYHITDDRVVGHNEVKATACPGQYFPWEALRTGARFGRHAGVLTPAGKPSALLQPSTDVIWNPPPELAATRSLPAGFKEYSDQ